MEANEITPLMYVHVQNGVLTESVWWDWTAPESGTVLIKISNSQPSLGYDAIAVYTLTDI